ncbi:hypothetical protein CEK28_08530 [Xenophilus sp. AP218F]|nr:hypothetical protein CEK28_08530 [Xenophilus sp. AP218F]
MNTFERFAGLDKDGLVQSAAVVAVVDGELVIEFVGSAEGMQDTALMSGGLSLARKQVESQHGASMVPDHTA